MHERVLIAGSGGQGIVFTGKLLATAALEQIPHITFFPSYGAEVRGGTSNCQVVLSSAAIASPVSETFDSMLIMNDASAAKFIPRATASCLVLVNGFLCRRPLPPPCVSLGVTEVAQALGSARAANLVMLGAYLARKPVVSKDNVARALQQLFADKGKSTIDVSLRAFQAGLEL
jgi:2-oxoglutarate ferredoxin oxidoreductase subunit gamma